MATPARLVRLPATLALLALAVVVAPPGWRKWRGDRPAPLPVSGLERSHADDDGVSAPATPPSPAVPVGTFDPTLPAGALRRLGSTLLQHARPIRALAFSPDGRHLLSASEDGVVAVWDTSTGAEVWRRASWPATSAVFSDAGGRVYLSGGSTGTHEALEASSGRPLFRVLGDSRSATFGGDPRAFALSPDGRLLAAAGRDNLVRVRSADTAEALWAATRPLAGGGLLTFDAGGQLLIVAADGSIERHIATTGQEAKPARLEGFAGRLRALAMSPDGGLVVATGDAMTGVWNLGDGSRVWSIGTRAESVGIARRAARVIAADRYNGFTVYELPAGSRVFHHDNAHSQTLAVAISPDGRLAASGGYGGDVRLWNLDSGTELLAADDHRGTVRAIAFLSTRPWLATGGEDGRLVLWDRATGTAIRSVDAGTHIDRMVARPDGRIAIAGAHQARLFDPAALEPWGTSIGLGAWGGCAFAISADGRRVARGCRRVQVWDLDSGRELYSTGEEAVVQPFSSLALIRSGTRLVGCRQHGGPDPEMVLWDVDAGRELWAAKGNRDACGPLLAVGDGPRLLGGGYGRLWWEISDGQRRALSSAGAARSPFALAPDGRRLAMPGPDPGSIEVWALAPPGEKIDTRPPLAIYRGGHRDGGVSALAFAPDGHTLYSAGEDATVVAWDLSYRPPPDTAVEAADPGVHRAGGPPLVDYPFDGSLASPSAVPIVADAGTMKFVAGRRGQALHLDGELTLDGLEPRPLEGSFTLELWLRLDAAPEAGHAPHLKILRSPLLTLDLRSGRPHLFRHFPGGGHMHAPIADELGPVEHGRWHHLAIVDDRERRELRVYLGGLRLCAAGTGPDRFESQPWPLVLGSAAATGQAGFSGSFDELRFYTHVRSEAEIAAAAGGGGDSVRSLEAPDRSPTRR